MPNSTDEEPEKQTELTKIAAEYPTLQEEVYKRYPDPCDHEPRLLKIPKCSSNILAE